MKMKRWVPDTQGQSLVLVALMAVVLVAFVGLAIDGGMAFSQRRNAQNAADGASLRGAFLMRTVEWRTQTDQNVRRDMLLTTVHSMAELHGVPDTNSSPGDAVNGNIIAYYRDADGEVPTITGNTPCPNDCPVIGTSPIPANAWGVEVDLELPFDSYFVGIIGLNEITVAAEAVSVAHVGPEANNSDQWVLFAKNEQNCDAYPLDNTHAIEMAGATNQVSGNVHSNGDVGVSQTQIQQPLNAEISYRLGGDCTGCGGSTQRPVAEIGVVLPSFDEYYTLVDEQTQTSGVGHRYDNLPTPPGYSRPTLVFTQTVLGSDGFANEPYTFIDGDLFITRTNSTQVTVAGMIVVNGNVTISAPRVQSAPLGVSILATGSIRTTSPNVWFNVLKPYQSASFDPMLAANRHVTALWSNADYSTNGGDVCNTPVIELTTPGWLIKGAVLGPKGRIVTTSTGANKQVNGSIIADTILVSGSGQRFLYNSSYFPPQPDIIELME